MSLERTEGTCPKKLKKLLVFEIDIDTYGSAIQLGSYVPPQLQELFLDAAIVNSSAILVIS